ncbi:protein FAM83B-like [Corythoichthys intestinalis]|uniref:protein FAM83B-like n=1 Tax=Corythoichthys intestinalis TaxID=161448 RepID=UPI0025A53BF5|nr:protein FAM83B-like [Corythoichthys intestinalis]XP_061791521.1 protein FAM83B-like [Nerophis lumbriciformis]
MASKESMLSGLSALKDDDPPPYIHPHYKESYRLAIYALLCGGKDAYNDFLQAEQVNHFLSDREIRFILENAEPPQPEDDDDRAERNPWGGGEPGQSTYFPLESDEEVPDLDLGWPEVALEDQDTSISLLFHPPRPSTPTIKEVIRKQIQDAKQVVAIAMDIFTDVDIFKEVLGATLRGVVVYILLDKGHFGSFYAMSHRAGVNIQDLKNIRVRTVRGQQYHCQSGIKFHGGLEQRFILVDCRSVLYGTYSYTWSFEKINVSMVLVITGQLVSSYDEEFRRLYARSTIPEELCKERSRVEYLREPALLRSPNSSQLSLQQLHMRPRGPRGLRVLAQEDVLDTGAIMTRGLSMQDRLHLSHFPDHMTRGHSFGGDLQKLNPMTRLRMGTKDIGVPIVPNRMSQQHIRHQNRYGPDQNLIPFNSETSLHRWKMDTYLNSQVNLDGSCDALSPLTSPYNSRTGLNDHQPQGIQNRSRDIKSRLDEIRQKRLSLQEFNHLRESQESLRSMYQSLDRAKFKSSLRGLDARQNVPEMVGYLEATNHKDLNSNQEDCRYHSTSYFDIQTGPEQKVTPGYEWYEPLARTTSAAHLEDKLKDQSPKYPGGLQRPRTMESLIEIPEEKEGSSNPVNGINAVKDRNNINDDKTSKMQLSEKKSGSQELKSPVHEEDTLPQCASELKSHPRDDFTLQRKNSTRTKSLDEKKTSKKEEKSLQRKASLRSQNSSGSNSRASPVGKAQGNEHRSSQNSIGKSSVETEKPKSTFNFHRLSSHRSSKRKPNPVASAQERGSQEYLEEQEKAAYENRQEKAYSRYEYLLRSSVPLDKAKRGEAGHSSENLPYQTHGASDNKLGRFMQRVGNLIGKNK